MGNFTWLRVLLLALAALSIAGSASAQVGIVVSFGPPALPVYEQPPCPGDNYIWAPGYWDFDNDFDDYYWVPGTWVLAPEPGLYWTPGYWGWTGNGFFFHEGYWAPEVGFYGGIVYGFGYFGNGYVGGRWDHDRFFYNRSVTNINTTIVHNVYNTTVVNNNVTVNRVSYNGGSGGVTARPTPQEEAAARQKHIAPVEAQTRHVQEARGNRELRASVNEGKPQIAATRQPGQFSGRDVVHAKEAGAPYHPPANRTARKGEVSQNPQPENHVQQSENAQRPENNQRANNEHRNVVHPRDLPPFERQTPPNTGDAKRDQKVQKQQEKLQAQQEKDRQKLEQKQEREDQKLEQKKADDARKQQMEQRHQQQTQQMAQKHEQQQQKMQPHQAPPEHRSEVRPPKEERPN